MVFLALRHHQRDGTLTVSVLLPNSDTLQVAEPSHTGCSYQMSSMAQEEILKSPSPEGRGIKLTSLVKFLHPKRTTRGSIKEPDVTSGCAEMPLFPNAVRTPHDNRSTAKPPRHV